MKCGIKISTFSLDRDIIKESKTPKRGKISGDLADDWQKGSRVGPCGVFRVRQKGKV